MTRGECGTVVEVRGATALVRLASSAACSDCAAAGRCHSAGGEDRQLEARNAVNAVVGDTVQLAIATRLTDSPAFTWALVVTLLLAGAAAATALAPLLLPPSLAGNAAGIGGIAGGLAGLLLGLRLRRSRGARRTDGTLPEITRVERPAQTARTRPPVVDSTGSGG